MIEMYQTRPTTWLWILLGSVLVISGLMWFASPLVRIRPYTSYYGMPMMGLGGLEVGLGMIAMVLFIVMIWMAVRYAYWGSYGHRGAYYKSGPTGALEILRERYAKGEITKEQYDQMLRDLQ